MYSDSFHKKNTVVFFSLLLISQRSISSFHYISISKRYSCAYKNLFTHLVIFLLAFFFPSHFSKVIKEKRKKIFLKILFLLQRTF